MKITTCRHPKLFLLTLICVLPLVVLPAGAPAQDAPADDEEAAESAEEPAVFEKMTVTAQKRESTVLETPLAVSAFDQAALDRNGIMKAEDLTLVTPNFKFGDLNLGFGGAQFTIRGISNDAITNDGDPSIAVYQDGVYLPRISSGNALLYDLERVEVLRGPQGTLWGRNTTSGAISVVPRRPTLEPEKGFELRVGSDSFTELRGVVNGPLVEDKLAGRFAVFYAQRDGLRSNGPASDGDDRDEFAARASLLWDSGDSAKVSFTADYYEQTPNGTVMASIPFTRPEDPTPFQYPFTADPQSFPLNTAASTDNNDWGLKLEAEWDLGSTTLTTLLGYRGNQRAGTVDRDGTDQVPRAEDLCRFSGPFRAGCIAMATPTVGNFAVTEVDSVSTSVELRLASSDDGPVNWITGAYYFEEEQDTEFDAFLEGLSGTGFIAPLLGAPPPLMAGRPAVRINRFDNQAQESTALFGQATFAFGSNDQFNFTAGARYTEDEKDDGDGSYVGFTLDPLTAPARLDTGPTSVRPGVAPICTGSGVTIYRCQLRQQAGSWDKTTWKVGLDWSPNDDWLWYASARTGYRAGGFNDANIYDPEELLAYELGGKGISASRKVLTDFALFYYDFSDQQVSQVVNAQIITRNAGKSTLQGAELVTNWLPNNHTRLDLTVAYLDASYDVFRDVDDPQSPGQQPEDLSGNKLPKAPEWSVNIGLDAYVWYLENGGSFTPRINFHWEDDYFLLPFNNVQNLQDSYTRTDLHLTYQSPGNWALEAWVDNLEDDDVLGAQFTTPNNLLTPPQLVGLPPGPGREELLLGSYLPPRTFGLSLVTSF
ncbi:MAG: TonB-dependent receptor [Thermoanaerobaculia bacterium]